MSISKLCGIMLAFLCSISIVGCDDDEDQGRKITDYKEYTLTIASKMLPGVVTSCGNSTLTAVYAVKNESQAQWRVKLFAPKSTPNFGDVKKALTIVYISLTIAKTLHFKHMSRYDCSLDRYFPSRPNFNVRRQGGTPKGDDGERATSVPRSPGWPAYRMWGRCTRCRRGRTNAGAAA